MRCITLTLALTLAASAAAAQDVDPPPVTGAAAQHAPEDEAGASAATSARDGADHGAADAEAAAGADAESDEEADADADPDAEETDADAEEAEEAEETDADAEETDADAEAPASTARWTDERGAAWATFAASFGVAVLGGVLLAAGVDDLNTIENAPGGTVWADVAEARDRAPILTGVGAVVLGLGTAGMAVSAALLAHFGQGGTWLEVSALPGGLLVRGRF